MTLLEEVTNGHGTIFAEVFSVTATGSKCRMRVYGRYLTTKAGKPRVFQSESAGMKAAEREVRALKKQTEKNRQAFLASLSPAERADLGLS